jgi:outer membrane protein assembly factor BamB
MRIKRTVLGLALYFCCAFGANLYAEGKGSTTYSGPQDKLHVYLLIGQSNMGGRARFTEEDAGVIPRCYLLNKEEAWEPAKNPFNIYSSVRKPPGMQRMNPSYGFVKIMLEKDKEISIGVVSNARGATKIARWAKGAAGEKLYSEAIRRTKIAQKTGILKGILWHQGEGNRDDPEYLEHLKALIADLRKDLNAPDLPFVAGQICQQMKNHGAINAQIAKLPDTVPFTGFAGSEGLTAPDKVHFGVESMKLLGKRYAEAMLKIQSKQKAEKKNAMVLSVFGDVKEAAETILNESAIKGGCIVHLGCGNGEQTAKLGFNGRFLVHGLDRDQKHVEQARKFIASKGLYGPITVAKLNGTTLPYADNLVNFVIAEDASMVSKDEIMRVLAPLGTALIAGRKVVKPWPAGMDEWTHFLHGPDNNAVSADKQISRPISLRWVTERPWGRSHDQFTTLSTMVTSGGILLYIMDDAPLASIRFKPAWTLIARDAFNGQPLWQKSIPKWINHLRWFRAGPTHLQRRLVAVKNEVYVTLGANAPVVKLEQRTGKILKTYSGTENTEEIVYKDGVLYLLVGTSEIDTVIRNKFTEEPLPQPTKSRHLAAIDATSGKELWRINARDKDYILPLGYAVVDDRVYVHSVKGLECRDAKKGGSLWLTERPTYTKRYSWDTSTLVATKDVVLLADKKYTQSGEIGKAHSNIMWAITQTSIKDIKRENNKYELIAYNAEDGKPLWNVPASQGYNSPADVFVAQGMVWVGSAFSKGYDLKTGKVLRSIKSKGAGVGMIHHRCYRNKATEKYIFTARDGIEVIDLSKGWHSNNSWLRGACSYGIMPANGLLYVPPDACGCHPHVKLKGLNAMGSTLPKAVLAAQEPFDRRLVKGPAFPKLAVLCAKQQQSSEEDWPVLRHDNLRSGNCETRLPQTLQIKWSTHLKGKLTQPVKAHSLVYVSSVDEHTVYALSESNGDKAWSYQVGGRVDSPPAVYRGLLIFGSADGYVHCLEAATGTLAWRFRAAPGEHLISSYGRFESSWPVHGAVLVMDDTLYYTAGRSSYMDGGLYFYKMDPATGKVLASNPIRHLDPTTGKQNAREWKFDGEGTLSDVLSGNGRNVFLKNMQLGLNGVEEKKDFTERTPHLYSPGGMLETQWFLRTYWHFGTHTRAGYAGWGRSYSGASSSLAAGRIMSFGKDRIICYGRLRRGPDPSGRSYDFYHLFCTMRTSSSSPSTDSPVSTGKPRKKNSKSDGGSKFKWELKDYPLIVRAMAMTPDILVVAGPRDVAKKNADQLSFDNDAEARTAYTNSDRKGELRLVSISDGKTIHKLELPAMPVFDGMITADKHVFLSTIDGNLICLGR